MKNILRYANKRKLVVSLTIIFLAIGFAAISTTLILNGTINIGVLDDFDVYFSEAKLDESESEKAVISADKKTITFVTNDLTILNDSSILKYKVKNSSSRYSADVTINCHTEENEYVSVTANFNGKSTPAYDRLKPQEEVPGFIKAKLIKGYLGEETLEVEIKCEISASPVQPNNSNETPETPETPEIPETPESIDYDKDYPVSTKTTTTTRYISPDPIVCKKATTLHTETCNEGLCKSYMNEGDTITYGSLSTGHTLVPGNAFDCDVNADGNYNSSNERFYYVSDYFDTDTQTFVDDTAVLIYYRNIANPSHVPIAGGIQYHPVLYASYQNNSYGPTSLISRLRTLSEDWIKPSLKKSSRKLLNEAGGTTTDNGSTNLHSTVGYSNTNMRVITVQELKESCLSIKNNSASISLDCLYLRENTPFTHLDYEYTYWTENPSSHSIKDAVFLSGSRDVFYTDYVDYYMVGLRPVIEVPKDLMTY